MTVGTMIVGSTARTEKRFAHIAEVEHPRFPACSYKEPVPLCGHRIPEGTVFFLGNTSIIEHGWTFCPDCEDLR